MQQQRYREGRATVGSKNPLKIATIGLRLLAARATSAATAFALPVRSVARVTRGAATMSTGDLVVDPFCYRQFREHTASEGYAGAIFEASVADFENYVNAFYVSGGGEASLAKGYAPFCKHLFVPNVLPNSQEFWSDVRVGALSITEGPDGNSRNLRSGYEARTPKELPILSRWFPRESVGALPTATWLDVILYSREQIDIENKAMGNDSRSRAPWGIVSVKGQDVDFELPMQPITVMRNALGSEHGGSGVDLKREKYMEAIDYWKDHAVVK